MFIATRYSSKRAHQWQACSTIGNAVATLGRCDDVVSWEIFQLIYRTGDWWMDGSCRVIRSQVTTVHPYVRLLNQSTGFGNQVPPAMVLPRENEALPRIGIQNWNKFFLFHVGMVFNDRLHTFHSYFYRFRERKECSIAFLATFASL